MTPMQKQGHNLDQVISCGIPVFMLKYLMLPMLMLIFLDHMSVLFNISVSCCSKQAVVHTLKKENKDCSSQRLNHQPAN